MTTSVSRHTECPKNQGAPSGCVVALCLTERVLLRGTSVRGLASLDERNIGRRFLLRPTEQISAECERVYVDLSLSCMAPEGRAAVTPYVDGNHANVQSASWWLFFPVCLHRLLVSSFASCPYSYRLCCGVTHSVSAINGCGLARFIVADL